MALGRLHCQERTLNQPPITNAGQDQVVALADAAVVAELDGVAIDDRLDQPQALFVTWAKVLGDGDVGFDDRHQLAAKATFTKRGRYVLQLTASDGVLASQDQMTVIVNQPPLVNAGADLEVTPGNAARLVEQLSKPADKSRRSWLVSQTASNAGLAAAQLLGALVDDGLGDPAQRDHVISAQWAQVSPKGVVHFEDAKMLRTLATFDQSGHYLLRLTVDNGSFATSDEVLVAVGARVTQQLQVLYTFEENGGASVHDVAGVGAPLDLVLTGGAAPRWIPGGLAIDKATVLSTAGPAGRIVDAVKASGEVTVEAWLTPSQADHTGLGRIITLSSGPGARNFILAQSGSMYHWAVRTSMGVNLSVTDSNASAKALAAAGIATDGLTHLVCTRDRTGLARVYLDGAIVSSRQVNGDFGRWDGGYRLAVGNEMPPVDGHDDRAWLGAFHLLAVYSRALAADEVMQNYRFGPDTNLPPVVSAGQDREVNQQPLPVTVQLEGSVTDDRPSASVTTQWRQVNGPGGVAIANANAARTTASFDKKGRYSMRLSADDGELFASADVMLVIDRAPTIAAATDAGATAVTLGLSGPSVAITLAGAVLDDGLGNPPGTITAQWSRLSGPRSAQIGQPDQLSSPVRLVERGSYQFQLSISNGKLLAKSAPIAVTVNQMPVIDAGQPQTILLPGAIAGQTPLKTQLNLAGTVIDSGLGNPADPVTVKWEQIGGPRQGQAQIGDPAQLLTPVTFSANGVYAFRLTVANGSFTVSDDVAITAKIAPVVDAGTDQTLVFPAVAQLDGTVSDDGWPDPPGVLALQWSKVSGPGFVQFADDKADFTSVTFVSPGVYVLRLTANDGHAATSDDLKITVNPPPVKA